MINPLIKNCRTGFHDDVLNRTSHYKRLLQIKAKTQTKVDKIFLSHSNKQMTRDRQESRGQQNLRIFNRLISIQRNSSRYKTESTAGLSNKKTLKNEYKQRQKSLLISQDNVRLLKKIEKAQSSILPNKIEGKIPLLQSKKPGQQLKRMNLIDDLYYKSFRMELLNGRVEQKVEKGNKKRLRDKHQKKSRYRHQTLNAYEQLRASMDDSKKT